ncbi:MAG: hypothetical protein E7216_04810 [Clostridium thermopalmarium]|uniref:hypothetical protein n=1 Tax=Clostridium thermopalmarium TaxID=29373 RepID=UPI0023571DB7|nr:hypothetical protein [Clostridium thermopalmarium]MBE6043540.1 hypothetical protein [Clostridium thermopalmarium]
MSKENAKKATFKDLIARKLEKEKDEFKTKDIYVSSMDAMLTFKKPKDDMVLDVMDEIGDGQDVRKMVGAFKKLIYLCCDMLQDTELHKELEVVDPFDTVEKIFSLSDILEIGEQLMDLIDMGKKVGDIKK